MPLVKPLAPASKYLAQKWESDKFKMHRIRVRDAPSMLDNSAPKQYPHLQLGLNRQAILEEQQNKYNRENQLLLDKIKVIVKGHGTVRNWNEWSRRDLHAAARLKQQRQIEIDNQAMLERLKKTRPVIQRVQQKKDFEKHKNLQEMLGGSVKDYDSPRMRTESNVSNGNAETKSERTDRVKEGEERENSKSSETSNTDTNNQSGGKDKELPPLPNGQKPKAQKPPPENRRKNRNANVPKLPAI
ncbi:sperm axonemal maintenance protein CFAP97D1-like [Watersipora subatra]|uniref:sperm axonemal maintenance protein CFAP97D1-like n=1 Tax=Watersipora subatra TaxID=2589382 RepID=UPI00355C4384